MVSSGHTPDRIDPQDLIVDTELDECKWYVSPAQPICGEEPVAHIKVKTKMVEAYVPLCRTHKAIHDRRYAEVRASRQQQRGGR